MSSPRRKAKNNERKIKTMKNRNIIFGAIVSALVSFALCQQMQAQETPDPVPGTVGPFNTADGDHALFSNTSGFGNSAFGWYALFLNADASFNTAVGAGALDLNNGIDNTAVGGAALLLNTTGGNNTAVGTAALEFNDSGTRNNAVGAFALFTNNGSFNNAHGSLALEANTTGIENEAFGDQALLSATTASSNVAVGDNAGLNITTGGENTLIGKDTGLNLDTLTGNIYIGVRAGCSVDEVAFIRIGEPTPPVVYDTFIQGIQDRAVSAAANPHFVLVDDNGKLGTVAANEIGGKTAQHQAMLNEFLKEHVKVEELQATVAQQQKQIEALTAGLQKVSAQIEVNKPAPQVVASKP
jgi:hypothetical protein